MSAIGRKRKSELRISSVIDVRFAPESGRSTGSLHPEQSFKLVKKLDGEGRKTANCSRSTSSSKGLFELHHPECLLEAVAYKELLSTRVF